MNNQLMCYKKKLFYNTNYQIKITTEQLLICKKENPNDVVYQVPLNHKTTIYWQVTENKLSQFGLMKKQIIKWFFASHDVLINLKSELSLKVVFDGFTQMYKMMEMIGESTSTSGLAEIFLVQSRLDGNKFATKAINSKLTGYQFKELNALTHLAIFQSPYFPKVKELFICEQYHLFIEELNDGNYLSTIIKQFSPNKLPADQTKSIIKQLLNCLRQLKVANLVHLDIKPCNIIISFTMNLKLLDFSQCEQANSEQYDSINVIGTPGYMAPELFESGNNSYSFQNDMFSVGCVFYELLSGDRLFFESASPMILDLNIECNTIEFDIANESLEYQEAFDLLTKMIIRDPQKRITVEEALEHQYFVGQDYKEFSSPGLSQFSEKLSVYSDQCDETTIMKLPTSITKKSIVILQGSNE